jgi:hypothetical protein
MRIVDKNEFIERFLYDQEELKINPSHLEKKKKQKITKSKSILPFKEETYLDIINLFREKFEDNIEIIKDKDIVVKYKGDIFNIKIICKRDRLKI